MRERRGVLVAASQSEREEETRDRAERGSAVRGSDQASVAAKRIPRLDPYTDLSEADRKHALLTDLLNRSYAPRTTDFTQQRKIKIVIRNSQLLLSLILSLLLIGVGLIGNGKRTGLATM